MHIQQLHLTNFKGFSDFTVECHPFTVLAGPNSGGKTSILHAIQLLDDVFRFAFGNSDNLNLSSPYWDNNPGNSVHRVMPSDPDALWFDKRTAEPFLITARYAQNVEVSLEVLGPSRYQLDIFKDGTSIKGTFQQSGCREIIEEIFNRKSFFLPAIGGISPVETFVSKPTLSVEIDAGRMQEHWRSYLWWLFERGDKEGWERIVEIVERYLPGVRIYPPRLSDASSPAVEIVFNEGSAQFDIGASGGGLRTLLNLAAIMQYSSSQCLLIDEPDAHLHGSLQTKVAQMLSDFAAESGTQIFVTSHAPDFIAEVSTGDLMWIDRADKVSKQCNELGRVLVNLGSMTKADAIRSAGADRLLFVEGPLDKNILGQMLQHYSGENPFNNPTVKCCNLLDGKGNSAHLPVIARLLREAYGLYVRIAAILDNDYELNAIEEPDKDNNVLLLSLRRKEIENYLIEPAVIEKAACLSAERRQENTLQSIKSPTIDEVNDELLHILEIDEIKKKMDEQYISRYILYDLNYSTARKEFDAKWANMEWRLRNCPGKEVLKRLRAWCKSTYKLNLSDHDLIESLEACPSDIAEVADKLKRFLNLV